MKRVFAAALLLVVASSAGADHVVLLGIPPRSGGGIPFLLPAPKAAPGPPLQVVIETTAPVDAAALKEGKPVQLRHAWGTTRLKQGDLGGIAVAAVVLADTEEVLSPTKRLARLRQRLTQAKSPSPWTPLAQEALLLGGKAEAARAMEEVRKRDPKNPHLPVWDRQLAMLARPVPDNPLAARWQKRLPLDGYSWAGEGLYQLLHKAGSAEDPGVKQRLRLLDDPAERVRLWFALQGVDLPEPRQRSLAVLPRTAGEFAALTKAFAVAPQQNGFESRRFDLAVFSPECLDARVRELDKLLQPRLQGVATDTFFKGEGDPGLQTLLLFRRALEEESLRSAAGQMAATQSLAATGLIPAGVEAPRWLVTGLNSCFATAPGAAGNFPGTGWSLVPADNHLLTWQQEARNLRRPPPERLLRPLVTDQLIGFPPSPQEPVLPRARAWSLVYFLLHRKPEALRRFCRELAEQPRDLQLTADEHLILFARAFDCLERGSPRKIDEARFRALALEWDAFVKTIPLEVKPFLDQVEQLRRTIRPPEAPRPAKKD